MMNQKPPDYILVENGSQLSQVAEDLEKTTAIGVDLEADSLFHYHEKVCLLQVSTPDQNFLIDPLPIGDLSPLKKIFSNPDIRKIFHGADYDMRSLHRDFDIEVNSLFDTQIAATFLGVKETGLASLLKHRFKIIVEKKYQKKDWSLRPLPKPMLDYATLDSLYLLPLAHGLEKELREKGRFFYVEEECERLSKVRSAPSNNSPLFLKFKGAGRLAPRSLTVLEATLQFRDEMARLLDRPPFKVFGSTQILKIVNEKPRNLKDLNAKRCLTPKQISGFGRPLLKKINVALNLSADKLLVYPKKIGQRVGPKVASRVRILKQWREERASQLGIDPALVCPNSQVQVLAIVHPKSKADLTEISEMKDWQRELFGKEICSLLNPS
jgi:ribonuclease D